MFKRLVEAGTAVTLTVDGTPVEARVGDTVAAALLAAGIRHCRTTDGAFNDPSKTYALRAALPQTAWRRSLEEIVAA